MRRSSKRNDGENRPSRLRGQAYRPTSRSAKRSKQWRNSGSVRFLDTLQGHISNSFLHCARKPKWAIDSGHAGDKVAANDPAAPPLGTEEEAGGDPPSAQQIRLAGARDPRRFCWPSASTGYPTSWVWILATALLTGAVAALAFVLR